MRATLRAVRLSQYTYTRPACALIGVGTVYTVDGLIDGTANDHHAAPADTLPQVATAWSVWPRRYRRWVSAHNGSARAPWWLGLALIRL